MVVINVSYKNLRTLDGIDLTGVTELYCQENGLTELPVLPETLIILHCARNELTFLPVLPKSLQQLDCYRNKLKTLPDLPDSLGSFDCSFNHLTFLPTLSTTCITRLTCNDNQLILLPELPITLNILNCAHNVLTELPAIPDSLTYLYCGDNKIKMLPSLPDHLRELHCWNNELNMNRIDSDNFEYDNLPDLPESLYMLDLLRPYDPLDIFDIKLFQHNKKRLDLGLPVLLPININELINDEEIRQQHKLWQYRIGGDKYNGSLAK